MAHLLKEKGKSILILVLFVLFGLPLINAQNSEGKGILIEAETFNEKGGWKVDPQFVEIMGSPYLLAHGLGNPVDDAKTTFKVNKDGNYHIWVRTKDWAPGDWKAPGRFRLKIDNVEFLTDLGTKKGWNWQYVGHRNLNEGKHNMALTDLTGFDGRCDAIYLSTSKQTPPSEEPKLSEWRKDVLQLPEAPQEVKEFDLVVTGGGIAGCAASIAAAEQGMKVALIQDRPVLGGNASSEIRVHTLGIYGHFERILKMLDTEHYPNGSPKAKKEDKKRLKNIKKYDNLELHLNTRAYNAHTKDNKIQYVDARHTKNGNRIRFKAPLFVDATGDGWIGYWAGAEYMYGREARSKYNEGWEKHGELWSPENPDKMVMGSSVLWRTYKVDSVNPFPEVPWAMEVAEDYSAKEGGWQWEFSRNDIHQVKDAEKIRDHMLKAIYGSFYNEKQKAGNDSLALQWSSYLVGKRESRRLKGDYIYTFNDVRKNKKFPDSVVVEERAVDVHYQQNLLDPTKPDFLSEALFYETDTYYVPYRSLYSKNIKNLFMAGRCFSSSHIGLGGPRVMRTTGQMGAAVGYAASISKKYDTYPRQVYKEHLEEYMDLVLSSDDIKIQDKIYKD